jgi:hypothetical protein
MISLEDIYFLIKFRYMILLIPRIFLAQLMTIYYYYKFIEYKKINCKQMLE